MAVTTETNELQWDSNPVTELHGQRRYQSRMSQFLRPPLRDQLSYEASDVAYSSMQEQAESLKRTFKVMC